MSSAPLLDPAQQVVLHGLRHRTPGQLLTAEELDSFASIVPLLITRYDVTGTCIYISEGCERFTAKPREWFVGRNLDEYEGYPAVHIQVMKDSIRRIMQSGELEVFETTIEKPWGIARRLHHQCPERNDKGEVVSVLSVSLDITERHNSQIRLERTVEQQRHFLAIMAHELRNPLAAVLSALKTLDRCQAEEVAKSVRGIIHREVTHITRLISDLLDITRLETGALRYCMKSQLLAPSLQLACSIVEPQYRQAGQILDTSFKACDVVIKADLSRLAQAVSNLLHNASKFSAHGSRVELATRVVGETVQIDVSDQAGGVPASDQERIFQRYGQADNVAISERSGLGLGLYVSREIIRQHGGGLELVRSSPEGSLFRIMLPIYRDADWDSPLNDDSISPENLKRQPERSTSVKESEESILIVDDNVVALNLLQILLELEGYTVYSATTAAAGEELFAAHRPSIVLLDVGLPDLNGCDLAERIRALPSGGSALLVAVTGWATEQDTQKSLDAGFDAHLAKPVSVDDLIALFKQHRAER